MVPPSGLTYWQRLAEAHAKEPVEERDRFFAAMLRPLGIEKGKPFQPDDRQKKILTEAASAGEAMAKALTFDKRSKGIRYRPDAQWDYVLAPDITTNENDSDEIPTQVLMALPENKVGKPSPGSGARQTNPQHHLPCCVCSEFWPYGLGKAPPDLIVFRNHEPVCVEPWRLKR